MSSTGTVKRSSETASDWRSRMIVRTPHERSGSGGAPFLPRNQAASGMGLETDTLLRRLHLARRLVHGLRDALDCARGRGAVRPKRGVELLDGADRLALPGEVARGLLLGCLVRERRPLARQRNCGDGRLIRRRLAARALRVGKGLEVALGDVDRLARALEVIRERVAVARRELLRLVRLVELVPRLRYAVEV